MKRPFLLLLALSLQSLAFGETLCFFVLPKDADAPEVRSSLQAYQARAPKFGAPVLEVDSLASVELTSTRTVRKVHDANGKVSEEAHQVPSIKITLPSGFQEKFGKITEENVDHRMMISLGDRILMAPMVRQRIDTASFLISLGREVTSDELTQIADGLRAMVKKPEEKSSAPAQSP